MARRDRKQVFQKAVAFLEQNLYHKITNREVAEHCGVCLSGLQRDFHNFADGGIGNYLALMRLEEAKKLLSQGLSVGEVADRLCYSSMPHFSMAFKKHYGVSPLQYKQQNKEK